MSKPLIIVTLGPATSKESDIKKLKERGVDFVRVNMSHSTIEDLEHFISLAKKIGVPFMLDTEGSQIRNGFLKDEHVEFAENDIVKIYSEVREGDKEGFCLKPESVVGQLRPGDILRLGFDSLILSIVDVLTVGKGYVLARVISSGLLSSNKGVAVVSASGRQFDLPPLSSKDLQAISIGLKEGIGIIAASFVRSGKFVEAVREATKGQMKIVSKIECTDALNNLEDIIRRSDYLLIDRGDLSKEISIERIPLVQKLLIKRAREHEKGVIVATNLLETMVKSKRPTRAEINDVTNSLIDGAAGLTLAAETAVGLYPIECVNMLNQIIGHVVDNIDVSLFADKENGFVEYLKDRNYLENSFNHHMSLIPPHGGRLINRFSIFDESVEGLPSIEITETQFMDAENIALGVFSPLEGFMGKEEVDYVLNDTHLPDGTVWPLPVVLDVSLSSADRLPERGPVALRYHGDAVGKITLTEKFSFGKDDFVLKLYGTNDISHPGVRSVGRMGPILLAGKIEMFRGRSSDTKHYELSPAQTRIVFEERGWTRVVGFHTRNVIHRGHEFIQLDALERESCDGLFVHPVVGRKKTGDFQSKHILESYEKMISDFYPKNKVFLSAFATHSRYAGPKEALFTAICRKNFGCSHFVVGRDHTGVGDFYDSQASQKIFDDFPELGIKPVKFNEVFYSKKLESYVHSGGSVCLDDDKKCQMSGTEARKMLEKGETPPEWFMRPEISKILLDARDRGENLFVRKGGVVWFTGLSGSGKSTLAIALADYLRTINKTVDVLDGDVVRGKINKHLGFSREDIRENNTTIVRLALELIDKSDFVLVPVISPYREDRECARKAFGEFFVEIFVDTPREICIKRDVKGLYKKFKTGKIKNMIGLSEENPYESPLKPDLHLEADRETVDGCVLKMVELLRVNNFL